MVGADRSFVLQYYMADRLYFFFAQEPYSNLSNRAKKGIFEDEERSELKRTDPAFYVCRDISSPTMFGIRCSDGTRAPRISTDYQEVYRLAQACNRCRLSPVHLLDVVTDFRCS